MQVSNCTQVVCNYRCADIGINSTLGLIPTGTADWLAFETRGLVRSTNYVALPGPDLPPLHLVSGASPLKPMHADGA